MLYNVVKTENLALLKNVLPLLSPLKFWCWFHYWSSITQIRHCNKYMTSKIFTCTKIQQTNWSIHIMVKPFQLKDFQTIPWSHNVSRHDKHLQNLLEVLCGKKIKWPQHCCRWSWWVREGYAQGMDTAKASLMVSLVVYYVANALSELEKWVQPENGNCLRTQLWWRS